MVAVGGLDWQANDRSKWTYELSSTFGQTLFGISRQDGPPKVYGILAETGPKIEVEGSDFISVDGHLVGLKIDELPCILAGTLPFGWRASLRQVVGKESTFGTRDDDRVIEVALTDLDATRPSFCATVSWRAYFFFSRSLCYCRAGADRRYNTLMVPGGYNVEWRADL